MLARIYRPAKSAMQSGRGGERAWRLDYEPAEGKRLDPLTGWTGSGDMTGQIRLTFSSREAAIAYAEKRGIAYEVLEPRERAPKRKSYAENFV